MRAKDFLVIKVQPWGLLSVVGLLAGAATLAGVARGLPEPVLVLGDLNASPWSSHFRRFLRDSGLRDSAQGRGVQPTWPAGMPWLWIPIDHCLHSPQLQVVARHVGPNLGSDHYPVVVDFVVNRK